MSRISTKKERLRYVMYNTLLQYCGFSISPIISELVSFMIPKGASSSVVVLGLIPGLTTTALSLTMLFLLMFMRAVDPQQEEEPISVHNETKIEYAGLEKRKSTQITPSPSVESFSGTANYSEDDSTNEYSGQDIKKKAVFSEDVSAENLSNFNEDSTVDYENERNSHERKLLACFMLYLFLNFTLRGILSILETFGAEMFQEIESPYSKPSFEVITNSGRFFVGMGCVGVIVLLALPRLAKKFTPFNCLLFGILCMSIGTLMFTDLIYQPNLTFFSVAVLLIWSLGSPITQTLTISTYSQMMGNKPQGAAMGWLTTAGSMGRILFPLIGGLGFTYIGYINFIAAILSGCAAIGFRIIYGLEK